MSAPVRAGPDSAGVVRVGIIGAGRWVAQHHLPSLLEHPSAAVTAIAEPNEGRRRLAQEQFGIAAAYETAEELCASGLVDAVVVASPPVAHYEGAGIAIDAGLGVLVEKPMTLESVHAWDLVRRAEAAGVPLVVSYPFNFTRAVDHARRLVEAGRIGDVQLTTALFATPRTHLYRPTGTAAEEDAAAAATLAVPDRRTFADPAVAGGGQGQTEVTHALANVLQISGLRARSVAAVMHRHDCAVDLVDGFVIEWEGGAIGSLGATGGVPPDVTPQRDFGYFGTEGVLRQDLTGGSVRLLAAGGVTDTFLEDEERYPAGAPASCLVELMAGSERNPAPGALGARVVECLEAAYRSAREGGGPVVVGPAVAPATGDGEGCTAGGSHSPVDGALHR